LSKFLFQKWVHQTDNPLNLYQEVALSFKNAGDHCTTQSTVNCTSATCYFLDATTTFFLITQQWTSHATTSEVRRKFSCGSFHSVAYGGHLYLVCAFCDVTVWRQIHVFKPTFWRSLLT